MLPLPPPAYFLGETGFVTVLERGSADSQALVLADNDRIPYNNEPCFGIEFVPDHIGIHIIGAKVKDWTPYIIKPKQPEE